MTKTPPLKRKISPTFLHGFRLVPQSMGSGTEMMYMSVSTLNDQ
jgi:hypothetical protein